MKVSLALIVGAVCLTTGNVSADEPIIGFTFHRTDLPGGRHANVRTMRATVMRADGSGQRPIAEALASEPDSWTQFAGWSPDGRTAVIGRGWNSPENARWEEEQRTFRFTSEGWLYDTFLVDFDGLEPARHGGEPQNVTAVERVSFYNSGLFFWPRDQEKLGFTALIGGVSKPYRMDRDGRNKVDLSQESRGFTYGFSSSPDGRRISYHENYQVYLADADGSNRQHVDTGHPFCFVPAWSPDGAWLLFLSGGHYDCHPYLVRADGTDLQKLADRGGYRGVVEFLDVPDFHGGSSDVPVWSHDGRQVFFTAKVGQDVELFSVTLSGATERLTHSREAQSSVEATLHYHPRPSPDGKWLLYGSKRGGVRNLYRMRLDDRREERITDLPRGSAAMHGHWRPGTNATRAD